VGNTSHRTQAYAAAIRTAPHRNFGELIAQLGELLDDDVIPEAEQPPHQ